MIQVSWAARALTAVVLLGSLGYGVLRAQYPLRWSGWAFGDAQAMFASDHLLRDGWLSAYALPNYYFPSPWNRHLQNLYTHYPQMVNIPVIATLKGLGVVDLGALQAFHVLLSCVALFFLWITFREAGDGAIAALAVVAVGLSVVWLDYMDSVVVTYDELFRSAALALLVVSERPSLRPVARTACSIGAWTVCLLQSLNSYEYVVALPVFVFVWTLGCHGPRRAFRRLLIFACAPALGLALHAVQVLAYLGWERAWQDAMTVLAFRTLENGKIGPFLPALAGGIQNSTGVNLLIWLVQLALLIGCLGLQRGEANRRRLALLLGLWASGVTWYFLFPQSTVNFITYMPKHVLPALAFGLALASTTVVRSLRSGATLGHAPRTRLALARAITGLLAASVLAAWTLFAIRTVSYASDFPQTLGPQTYPPASRQLYTGGVVACLELRRLRTPDEISVVVERGVFGVYTTGGRLPIVSAVFPFYCDSDVMSVASWEDLPPLLSALRSFYDGRLTVYLIARRADRGWPLAPEETVALSYRSDVLVGTLRGESLAAIAGRPGDAGLLADPVLRRRWPLGSLRS